MFHRIILGILFIGLLSACMNNPTPSFSKDIAPIVEQKCLKCHNSEGAGPFPLTNYTEIAAKGKLIDYVVTNKIMPPWPADPLYAHFIGELALSDLEIKKIHDWVELGMPSENNQLALVSKQSISKNEGEMMVVKTPVAFHIKGNNQDHFFVAKYPIQIPVNTYIEAIEFVPDHKQLVHHMNAHLLNYDQERKANPFKSPYWIEQNQRESQRIHQALNLGYEDGTYPEMTASVCNYLPGAEFSKYPQGIGGFKLNKRAVLYLNDIHFGPSPIDVYDSSYFKIYLSKKAPVRPVSEFQIGTLGLSPVQPVLSIPADSIKKFKIEFTVPQDISVLNIVPHMHLIGKSFKAYGIKPSGDTLRIISIQNWDFRWQYFYRPPHLLKVPRGTKIIVEALYDNTSQNPNNPFTPPRRISERNGSMRTTDEMLQLILTYVPYQKGDEDLPNE